MISENFFDAWTQIILVRSIARIHEARPKCTSQDLRVQLMVWKTKLQKITQQIGRRDENIAGLSGNSLGAAHVAKKFQARASTLRPKAAVAQ